MSSMREVIDKNDIQGCKDIVTRSRDLLEATIKVGFNNFRPLEYATINNKIEIVGLLIGMGGDINGVNKTGWTVLNWASFLGYLNIVELILGQSNLNLKYVNFKNMSCLSYTKTDEIGKLLIERGATMDGYMVDFEKFGDVLSTTPIKKRFEHVINSFPSQKINDLLLNEEVLKLKSEISNRDKVNAQLNVEIVAIKKENEKWRAETERLNGEVHSRNLSVSETLSVKDKNELILKTEIERLKIAADMREEEVKELFESWQKKETNFKIEYEKWKMDMGTLRGKTELSQKSEIEKLTKDLSVKKENELILKNKIEKLGNELITRNNNIIDLKEDASQRELSIRAELDRVKAELGSKNTILSDLVLASNRHANSFKTSTTNLEKELKEKNSILEDISQNQSVLSAEWKTTEKELRAEVAKLNSDLAAKSTYFSDLKTDLTKKTILLKTEHDQLKADLKSTTEALTDLTNSRNKNEQLFKNEIDRLRQELLAKNYDISDNTTEWKKMTASLEKEKQNLMAELHSKIILASDLSRTIALNEDASKKEIARITREFEAKNAKSSDALEDWKKNELVLKGEIQKQSTEINQKSKQITDTIAASSQKEYLLNIEIQNLSNELTIAKKNLSDAKEEWNTTAATLRGEVSILQRELHSKKSIVGALQKSDSNSSLIGRNSNLPNLPKSDSRTIYLVQRSESTNSLVSRTQTSTMYSDKREQFEENQITEGLSRLKEMINNKFSYIPEKYIGSVVDDYCRSLAILNGPKNTRFALTLNYSEIWRLSILDTNFYGAVCYYSMQTYNKEGLSSGENYIPISHDPLNSGITSVAIRRKEFESAFFAKYSRPVFEIPSPESLKELENPRAVNRVSALKGTIARNQRATRFSQILDTPVPIILELSATDVESDDLFTQTVRTSYSSTSTTILQLLYSILPANYTNVSIQTACAITNTGARSIEIDVNEPACTFEKCRRVEIEFEFREKAK